MKPFWIAAVFACAAAACGRGSARAVLPPEPPPPLIEQDLGPGSGLIDPRADAIVRLMSDRLAGVQAFALEAEEILDEVPEHSPRQQLTTIRRVALRRPD